MAEALETAVPRVRARALDLPLGRFRPGRFNAITDVDGVLVGHTTLIAGEGPLPAGQGPGAHRRHRHRPQRRQHLHGAAARRRLRAQRRRRGLGPHPGDGVGPARDAHPPHQHHVGGRGVRRDGPRTWWSSYPGIGDEHDVIIPVVGECDDSWLNDITGRHVREEHVRAAVTAAATGRWPRGASAAGTGMVTCDFKAGIGTSSRKLPESHGGYTLGVLVMSNFGKMHNLRVGGLPRGRGARGAASARCPGATTTYGSIIAVVATDAPLLPNQINRLCQRVALGIGRVGSYAAHGSGEIVVGFSTANVIPRRTRKMVYQGEVPPRSAPGPALRGGDGGHRGGDPQLDVHGRRR